MKTSAFTSVMAVLITLLASVFSQSALALIIYQDVADPQNWDSGKISHHTTLGPVLVDDFTPYIPSVMGNTHVIRVDWWGSAAASDQWEISFHTNNSGQPNVDNPGEGAIAQQFLSATGLALGNGLYFYTAEWAPPPQDLMLLQNGIDYWFSVANFSDGWIWANGGGIGGAPNVGSEQYNPVVSTGADCLNGGPHCGPWLPSQDTNFAFRITAAVPEPATILMMGIGLLGLGYARRWGN